MKEYKEIFRLKEMLEDAGIPFEFEDRSILQADFQSYQIGFPVINPMHEMVCSVTQGFGTYGADVDKLEIMGLLTEKELAIDSVRGWLTAENVFNRIEAYYKAHK
jgi:hypothetical protein